MKRFLLSAILTLFFMSSYSQTKICGVRWGEYYIFAKNKLEQKFGKCDDMSSDGDCLVFRYKQYGGINFSYLSFHFQKEGTATYLNQCVMAYECKTEEEAKSKRDYIASVVGKQYSLNSAIGEGGFKYYYGGTSPTNPVESAFVIDVLKIGSPLQKGYNYAARIMYGPYNFAKEEF